MYDLRAPNLEIQALEAIHDHAQNTVEPTADQLGLIAGFQRTARRFFSSDRLYGFANGGPAPRLPRPTTESERRGHDMFLDARIRPGSTKGICALCHSGPMLNRTNKFAPALVGGQPGDRIANIGVSELNPLNLPMRVFLIGLTPDDVRPVLSPDLGVLLTFPPPPDLISRPVDHIASLANFFKIPSLWGVAATAPYFHDNHAKSLEDVAEFYRFVFTGMDIFLTDGDLEDIVAFLKLFK
jgi:cytochrome c peroxidase